MTEQAPTLKGSLRRAATAILSPPRTALAVALGYTDAADFLANWDSEAPGVLVWQREAAYALVFVNNDGSLGAHNSVYARELLDNALAHVNAMTPLAKY